VTAIAARQRRRSYAGSYDYIVVGGGSAGCVVAALPTGQGAIVYLVTMNGHFVDKTASVPPGAHLPVGTYMSMVIDAKTFQGLDYGIGSQPPAVAPASFGPVTYLKVS
jgi:hypothetical protein